MPCKGYIDSFYHGSAIDGKGLRSVIFFSGCNLRCPFCHNPETLYRKGGEYTAQELKDKIIRYKNYIKNGGVTLSGGEPFLQRDFALELIELLGKDGIKTAAETNGTLTDLELIKNLDFLIVDVKNQTDDAGANCENFLSACQSAGKRVLLTNVLVPGMNDGKDKIERLRELKSKFSAVSEILFLPFRKLCEEKYRKLGIPFPYSGVREAAKADIEAAEKILNEAQ